MAQYLPVKRLWKCWQYVQPYMRILRQVIYNRKVCTALGGDKSDHVWGSSRADPPTKVLKEKDDPVVKTHCQDFNLPEESAVIQNCSLAEENEYVVTPDWNCSSAEDGSVGTSEEQSQILSGEDESVGTSEEQSQIIRGEDGSVGISEEHDLFLDAFDESPTGSGIQPSTNVPYIHYCTTE